MTVESDLITRWRKTIEFYEALRYAAAETGGSAFSSKSLIELTADFEGMLGGTQYDGIKRDLFAARSAVVATFKVAERTFARHVFDYKEVSAAEITSDTFDDCWTQLFRYYAENAKRVASRGFVFGTPTAGGSNVGTGTVVRCNVDAWGFTRENQTPDAKLLRCENDATSAGGGIPGEEEFSIRSTSVVGRDGLEEEGSGKSTSDDGNFKGLTARTTASFGLLNPSFSTSEPAGPTAVPADLGGWESNVAISGTTYELVNDGYRGSFGDNETFMALRCKSFAFILSQVLTNPRFEEDVPYYRHIAVRRKSSADGTLKFRLGRAEATVSLATLTNDVWYIFSVSDSTAWYKNFGEADLALEIERSGGSTGSFDVDDVTIGQFQPFDGGFYAVVGGATLFQVEDKFTFTDAVYGTAINQEWFWRALGLYLPSCPSATATAPTAVLAGVGAGNVDNGAHTYTRVWVDVNGIESPESSTVAVTVVDKTADGKVTVARVAASPGTHIAYWRIYRSKAATTTPRYKLADVAIGTATYLDNTADASLPTTTPPTHTVSFLDPP